MAGPFRPTSGVAEKQAVPSLSRRAVIAGLALAPCQARAAEAQAWDFSLPALDGGMLDLAAYRGRVLLVANTASFCGFADQFRTLETLSRGRARDGLTVIGMPSNDFEQEAGSNAKVKQLCELTYGVDFPMAGLTHVVGSQANPFYAWVRQEREGWQPAWNFNKVLIGRNGQIRGVFRAPQEPDGAVIQAAIGQALSAGS